MRKISLLLGLAFLMSVNLFAQDQERYEEQATEVMSEIQANFELDESHISELKTLLIQVLHKYDVVQNSKDIEIDDKERAVEQIATHYKEKVAMLMDAEVIDDFMSYSHERFEFLD